MNVIDSSAWLEYFGDGPNAGEFADAIADTDRLIVPSITLFEVFKRVRLQRDLDDAILWTQDADFEGVDGVEYRAVRGCPAAGADPDSIRA